MQILREHIASHDFSVEQGYSVSPQKVWWNLCPKAFNGRWGAKSFWQIYWGTVLHGEWGGGGGVGVMIISCQGQESFTNTFSSNLKTVNLKTFANHKRIQT